MAADVRWPTAALAVAALFASSISADAPGRAPRRHCRADFQIGARRQAREGCRDDAAGAPSRPSVGPPAPSAPPAAAPVEPKDPREGEAAYEQARQLMLAVDAILQDTAEQRTQAQKLPGRDEFILTPLWTETREDREARIRNLLDSALGIVTDVPIVEMQKKVEGLRQNIREHRIRHRHAEGKADHGAEGRHAAGRAQRHGGEPRQQHQGCRAAHRQEPGRDRQDQDARSPARWPSRASS